MQIEAHAYTYTFYRGLSCQCDEAHNALMKRAYFMTVIGGVFCVGRACDKQTRDTFQSPRLTGVRLWAVVRLQTVW